MSSDATSTGDAIESPLHWGSWLSALAIVVATTVVLRLQGRRWWCACGSVWPWTAEAHGSHNSQHFIDPYSLTHVLHGVILFGLLKLLAPRLAGSWRLCLALTVECLWEIVENTPMVIERYRAATAAQGYTGDSVANSLGDIATCAAGLWLAPRLGVWWSVAVVAAVEILLAVWIRDCLFLSTLMLIWPLEPIKAWQTGG